MFTTFVRPLAHHRFSFLTAPNFKFICNSSTAAAVNTSHSRADELALVPGEFPRGISPVPSEYAAIAGLFDTAGTPGPGCSHDGQCISLR